MSDDIKILAEGRFIRLLSRNGWEFIQRTNCNGIAVIIALTESNEVLLVEQYRPPIESDSIELPAGLIDDGEGADGEGGMEAAKRELLEETGYVADEWHEAFKGPGGAGASADVLNFFIALQAKRVGFGGGDATEKIAVHAIPLSEIEQWLVEKQRQGVPVDPKIYAGLYFLNKYNRGAD